VYETTESEHENTGKIEDANQEFTFNERRRETMKEDKLTNADICRGWARFFMDESSDSKTVYKLLSDASFPYITFPVQGVMGPELRIGRCEYRGLEEIKKVIGG
jgi:hypothetical protein